MKENQFTEEQILGNTEHTPQFSEFLTLLGDKVRLKGKLIIIKKFWLLRYLTMFNPFITHLSVIILFLGFDRYKGGLDTVHDLTGLYSIFTRWRGIEIMFHVSTHLPNEPNDHQKVVGLNHLNIPFWE